ncbi:MAG TPA: capsule assembly Wzi family protein [Syntrophobacteraceae bacterium]|nr:capsule assembly Wzi family protein [Syntrophobacteraceae bacterium]
MPIFAAHESGDWKRARLWSLGIALTALLTVFTAGIDDAVALPSNNVPLDDWSYAALDKLAGFGLIHSDVHGMRPYTRQEVARLVNEALDYKEERKADLPPLIEGLLERFQKEFREELTVYGRGKDDEPAAFVFKPIVEAKADYVHSDGQPKDFLNVLSKGGVRQYPSGAGGIVGYEGTPLLPYKEGVVYGQGNNFSFQFASSFQLWDLLSGWVEPIVIERGNSTAGRSTGSIPSNVGSLENTEVDLFKGYIKFSPFDWFEAEFGRDSMWWGQGDHGTLILTDNAAPLDMLKISNSTPSLLPWYFSYLGPFKYAVFCAVLEDDRDYADTKFGGMRLDFKPIPNLEIGMSHTFMFGGQDGPSPNSFYQFVKLAALAQYSTVGVHNMAAFDWRYRMPFLWNAEFYGEWGGNDAGLKPEIRNFLFQDIGYILGLYFPRIDPQGRADLRIEYADNVNEGGVGSKLNGMWYTHGTYTTGVTYNGLILGDAIGPDARDIYVRVSYYVRNNLKAGVDAEYWQTGANVGPAIESEYQTGADITWDINPSLSAMVRYGWGAIQNFDLVRSDNRSDNLLMLELRYKFF